MQFVSMMKTMNKHGMKPQFYEWADDKWTQFVRPDPTGELDVSVTLQPRRSYDNAVAVAKATGGRLQVYIGWAFDPQFGGSFGVEHAWNVGPDGAVYDYSPNWRDKANAFYCGVLIPLDVAEQALALREVDFFYAVQTILFPGGEDTPEADTPEPAHATFVDLAML